MNINYKYGDIITVAKENGTDVIAHGCNCFHTMGAGVARRVNEHTRGQALARDKETIYGDINKLGTYSSFWYDDIEFFNLYTQYVHDGNLLRKNDQCKPVFVSWMAFYESMREMIENMSGETVIVPEIGCGLANGKQEHFERILTILSKEYEYDKKLTITVVKYGQ